MSESRSEWPAVVSAVAVVAASVAVGGWILTHASTREEAATVSTRAGTSLLRDPRALMLAGRRRDVLVGLAVRPGRPIDVYVDGKAGRSVTPADVTVQLDGAAPLPAEPCGQRCFRFRADVLDGAARQIRVTVGRSAPLSLDFSLPARMPPVAASLLEHADRKMRRLRSVVIDESLTAGVGAGINARFTMIAPDRMSYVTSSGDRAVVIGTRRWDRRASKWEETDVDRLSLPAYMWAGASRARLLGRSRLAGEPVRVLSAFRPDPTYPAWFRLFVARDRTIVRADMFAPSHFMVDRLSHFDGPVRIDPPPTA